VALSPLLAGEPVVLPTDTVYGLCALPVEDAVRRIRALKGTPETQAISLLCADVERLLKHVPSLRGRPEVVLLPGAFTLIVPNPERAYPWLSGSSPDTLGVRVPVLAAETRDVVASAGAVAATSANLHAGPDPRRLEDVPPEIRAACGALVDGGELPGTPSTVIDFTGAEPRVLREGAASSADAIRRVRGHH
jgi:L-threonylcarbamoyladenylate synthase